MKCSRNGCKQDYEPENNIEGSCVHHSGTPVFHEGLKSWSCCSEKNKPVLDFESFLALPGCTTGTHTSVAPKAEVARSTGISNFKEPSPASAAAAAAAAPVAVAPPPPTAKRVAAPPQPVVFIEEEDDVTVPVAPGTKCLRNGCKKTFVSNETSRSGQGPDGECIYHPAPPLFREGSKGYLCCKRKVLEFDEFLKIEGCKNGKHLFVKKKPVDVNGVAEEFVKCRLDHYQTPGQVHASVFAKKADRERSKIVFTEQTVELDVILPDAKRFVKTLELYGPINPHESTFTYFGTKIDLLLVKRDARSWNGLERTDPQIGQFTFGVGGRTGSVGEKAPMLDEGNRLRSTT